MAGPHRFESKLNEIDRTQILELVCVQLLPQRQAARAFNARQDDESKHITHTTVGRIVRQELEKLAEEQRGMTDALRQKHQLILDSSLRIAYSIAAASKCGVCNGEKTILKDRLDPDLGSQVCPKCDGSGRNEDDATRISALGQVTRLLERHAKMFGIDAPVGIDVNQHTTVALDVSGLSLEALSIESDGMFRQAKLDKGDVLELEPAGAADTLEPSP